MTQITKWVDCGMV